MVRPPHPPASGPSSVGRCGEVSELIGPKSEARLSVTGVESGESSGFGGCHRGYRW